MKISPIGQVHCLLGEGPVWSVEEQALYFCDVWDKKLWRYTESDESFRAWELPVRISSLALDHSGGAVVALETGIHRLDLDTGDMTLLADPAPGVPHLFPNDGKADAAGRFVFGTVDAQGGCDAGLFSIAPNGTMTQLDDGFGITNGPCWSPDGKTLYFADSAAHRIYAYRYDPLTGSASERRLFADTSAYGGVPDGATVDTQGRLWTAMCDGAQILCYNPDGAVCQVIQFPTGQVSSLMFGGPALDRLYVTTIDAMILTEIGAAANAVYGPDELGGTLFGIAGLGVTGLAEHRFGRAG